MTNSLFARLAVIALAGLLTAQAVSFWLQADERAVVVMRARGADFAGQIARAVKVLEATGAERRPATARALQSNGLDITLIDADQASPSVPRGQIRSHLAAALGSGREIRSAGMYQRGGQARSFDVLLQDGQWIRVSAAPEEQAPALPTDLIAHLFISLAVVTSLTLLALRQVSKPLHTLAEAADMLGQDLAAPPLAEKGSAETRRAARAFNRMQARVRRLVTERARALAAVSHDLRTPLTRLRLRAELIDDGDLREQITADVDAMRQMIDTTLDYLRSLHDPEEIRRIDINGLLQSLVEDATRLGKHATLDGSARWPYPGKLLALTRAVQNLIDNAIKYGGCAHVRICDEAAELRIVIEDRGLGIPQEELAKVTAPYYRPDAARNPATGGVGLGLSIVKDVALLHGGELLLENVEPSGLRATLILPRTGEA
ncbi:ATP-binding protein [Uliginosibacterium sp. sgz301328]|uniref:ATP-binding protein n=1 Tax=Uliginosibacterium sp. sgz301328 TaxID=3243764 RepID=UPI00359EADAA